MKCPVCEISSSELAFMKNGYKILRCKNCGHLFAKITISLDKVNEIYSDDYFFGATAGYPDYKGICK
jgi:transcription elongation factor Elf1